MPTRSCGEPDLTSEPMVSVLVSTRDRPDLLRQALASVQRQTLTDYEVLVCDDAGRADSTSGLRDLGFLRLRLLRNPSNLGVGLTNRRLYRSAQGRYLAHLDDDDMWAPSFLEQMVAVLEQHPSVSLAFCNHQIVIGDEAIPDLDLTLRGERDWGRAKLKGGLQPQLLALATVQRAIPTSHAAVVRRDALDLSDWPDWMHGAWDLWVAYLAAREGRPGYFLPDRLSYYRLHPEQLSMRPTLTRVEDLAVTYRAIWTDPRTHRLGRPLASRVARAGAYRAVYLSTLGAQIVARRELRRSLATSVTLAGIMASPLLFLPERATRELTSMTLRVKSRLRRLRTGPDRSIRTSSPEEVAAEAGHR